MGRDGFLLYAQQTAIGPCHEPDESSRHRTVETKFF